MNAIVYTAAFHPEWDTFTLTLLIAGLFLSVIGIFLPKCKPNRTAGIRIKWTLENEDNWSKTHRFSGKVWIIGGILIAACAFLPLKWLIGAVSVIFLLLLLIPVLYSYRYYRMHKDDTNYEITPLKVTKAEKAAIVSVLALTVLILIYAVILLCTADFKITLDQDALHIEANGWHGETVPLEGITSVTLIEMPQGGTRKNGFGAASLQMGSFYHDTLGTYTRYTKTGSTLAVKIETAQAVFLLSEETADATKALYLAISERISEELPK